MKSMGDKFLLDSKTVTPRECLQYALTQPASVMIHAIEKMEYLEDTMDVVKTFQPLTREQLSALVAKNQTSRAEREVRTVQDHRPFRFDGEESAVAGLKTTWRLIAARRAHRLNSQSQ